MNRKIKLKNLKSNVRGRWATSGKRTQACPKVGSSKMGSAAPIFSGGPNWYPALYFDVICFVFSFYYFWIFLNPVFPLYFQCISTTAQRVRDSLMRDAPRCNTWSRWILMTYRYTYTWSRYILHFPQCYFLLVVRSAVILWLCDGEYFQHIYPVKFFGT